MQQACRRPNGKRETRTLVCDLHFSVQRWSFLAMNSNLGCTIFVWHSEVCDLIWKRDLSGSIANARPTHGESFIRASQAFASGSSTSASRCRRRVGSPSFLVVCWLRCICLPCFFPFFHFQSGLSFSGWSLLYRDLHAVFCCHSLQLMPSNCLLV